MAAASSTKCDVASLRRFTRTCTQSHDGIVRKICRFGSKCYRANPEHLKDESHPNDADYLSLCRQETTKPEFMSIRKLFEWCDVNGTGKAPRAELGKVWPTIKMLAQVPVPDLTDEVWNSLDDDGNGYINFSEFCEFTTKYKVGLPLGLDDLLGGSNAEAKLRCGVHGCFCQCFKEKKRRCKYGEKCYQTSLEHREAFLHVGDEGWEDAGETDRRNVRDSNMCACKHKLSLHSSGVPAIGAVPYPDHWTSKIVEDREFNELVPIGDELLRSLQQLLDSTYSDVTTRDRVKSSGSWMVPQNFRISSAMRNENSRLWRKYSVRKAELYKERQNCMEHPEASEYTYLEISDVQTSKCWEAVEALERPINEWYLFHGTSASAAKNICNNDFKMRLAGSATGTLYGRGTYLAESITKADEYAKVEDGEYTVLLCRVLGGRVKYCDERTPDADALTKECVEGPYDCILGDRKKVSGTYREFIVFDTENVYPEYMLKYKRGELFKSPTHP